MFVSFSVQNYLSIHDRLTIDFVADSIREYKESQFSPFRSSNNSLLKSVAIFGSNGCGKSNLFKAVDFVKTFILSSSKETQSGQPILVEPFLLSSITKHLPSTFEAVFYIDNRKFRYGFAVTQKYVDSEWLFVTDKRKEEKMFIRARQDYSFEKTFKAGLKGKFELFAEVTRPNSLFLSVLAQFNSPICMQITEWFSSIHVAHDIDHHNLVDYTASLMSIPDYKKLINEIFIKTDLGIERLEEKLINSSKSKTTFNDLVLSIAKENSMSYKVFTYHNEYDNDERISDRVIFELMRNESLGTQRFFGILGPILEAVKTRKILLIDELDAHLHTLLFDTVVALFNSNKFNPNGAQLVFTAHNLHILKKGMRRDQILLMKKDEVGRSSLSSLHASRPDVRSDASFDKDYILGRYGAIPQLNTQMNLFDKPTDPE